MASNDISSYSDQFLRETGKDDEIANIHQSQCPISGHSGKQGAIWLRNPVTGTEMRDTLHHKAAGPIRCGNSQCSSSIVAGLTIARPNDELRTSEEVLDHATEFLKEFYESVDACDSPAHLDRLGQVQREISEKGTYDLTIEELTFGARLAWRNSGRCVARMFWSKLEIFDCRHVTTAAEMKEALIKHVEFGWNGGNIRAAITVFPQRVAGRANFRMWSSQFFNYAGYQQEDGSVIGDPSQVDYTKVCQKLGWKSAGTRFDLLPIIVSAPGEPPLLFEVSKRISCEVELEHPQFDWFKELKLKWFGLPAVADMRLDVGGVEFTAAPFNGWYTSPEIGTRNFCDVHRYNITEEVARKMGLDVSTNNTLWKDKAMVHVNVAVLHSFQKSGISIVDHHTASDAYMQFMLNETAQRGGCPSDWVWLVPPISGAQTSLYHQQMLMYKLRPSYEYQEKGWKDFLKDNEDSKEASELEH